MHCVPKSFNIRQTQTLTVCVLSCTSISFNKSTPFVYIPIPASPVCTWVCILAKPWQKWVFFIHRNIVRSSFLLVDSSKAFLTLSHTEGIIPHLVWKHTNEPWLGGGTSTTPSLSGSIWIDALRFAYAIALVSLKAECMAWTEIMLVSRAMAPLLISHIQLSHHRLLTSLK